MHSNGAKEVILLCRAENAEQRECEIKITARISRAHQCVLNRDNATNLTRRHMAMANEWHAACANRPESGRQKSNNRGVPTCAVLASEQRVEAKKQCKLNAPLRPRRET